jgi:FtsP/CotA-like multicopper oxidase with cupredoxin domain
MRRSRPGLLAVLLVLNAALDPGAASSAREPDPGACPRPPPGSAVAEPQELRSREGVLSVDLTLRNDKQPDGSVRYCYLAADGAQSPTLRLRPGDLLILRLRNALKPLATDAPVADMPSGHHMDAKHADPCSSGAMSLVSTNLHFHGLTVPPVCHQDDVLKTSIQPGDPTFEYRIRIPEDEPPGLYWYHPHIHGFTTRHVLGGASGALIVEGIERANADLARLPERVLVIRDQDLLNPSAPPSRSEPVVPKMLIDRDGDAANNGTGFGKPAKDLSVNFVPVPYPDYPPATLSMKPGERELWRVLNASAVTYLNLALLIADRPQLLGLVALDGVPLQSGGGPGPAVLWRDRLGVPPGARVEFIVTAPAAGTSGLFVTRTVDTGQGGENDPNRALVVITASGAAPEPGLLPAASQPLPARARPWLGDVPPVRIRKLFFSEKLSNAKDPNSATTFYLTLDGQTPTPFDPNATEPNIVVRQGEVEDWIVENRSTELHAFHIHQLHFLLLDWNGVQVDEPFLRDTVNVPYYNGHTLTYPSVRLRMDFRDPNIVGTFVYHCHLLEHEDGGMMGTIQVLPAGAPRAEPKDAATGNE